MHERSEGNTATLAETQAVRRVGDAPGRIENSRRGKRVAIAPPEHLLAQGKVPVTSGEPGVGFTGADLGRRGFALGEENARHTSDSTYALTIPVGE